MRPEWHGMLCTRAWCLSMRAMGSFVGTTTVSSASVWEMGVHKMVRSVLMHLRKRWVS